MNDSRIKYLGEYWKPNTPRKAPSGSKYKYRVLASKNVEGKKKYKLISFGARGYKHNYSPEAKRNYLRRSAGIKRKDGSSTLKDKFSANYWSRRFLWNRRKPADGKAYL